MLKQSYSHKQKHLQVPNYDLNVKRTRQKLTALVGKIKLFQNVKQVKKGEQSKRLQMMEGLKKVLEIMGVVVIEELTTITYILGNVKQNIKKHGNLQEKNQRIEYIKPNQELMAKIKQFLYQQHSLTQYSQSLSDKIKNNKQIHNNEVGKFRKINSSKQQQFLSIAVTPTWKDDPPRFYQSFEEQPNSPPTRQQQISNKSNKNKDKKLNQNPISLRSRFALKINSETVNLVIKDEQNYQNKYQIKDNAPFPFCISCQKQQRNSISQINNIENVYKLGNIQYNSSIPLSRSIQGPPILELDLQHRNMNGPEKSILQVMKSRNMFLPHNKNTNININKKLQKEESNRKNLKQQQQYKQERGQIVYNPQKQKNQIKIGQSQLLQQVCRKYRKMAHSVGENKRVTIAVQEVERLKQEVAYYCDKYQNYKNIADRQEQLIINLREELKQCKYHLNNAKIIAKSNLEGNLKVKAAEIARLNEELAEYKQTIVQLQSKINYRNRTSEIQICEQDIVTRNYVKQLQQLVNLQETALAKNSCQIKELEATIEKQSKQNANLLQQLQNILETLNIQKQQKIRAIKQKEQIQLINRKIIKAAQKEKQKVQALGTKIVEMAETNLNRDRPTNQQLNQNQVVNVR